MLVDLVGSEKVRKTQASGQTLKKAQGINKRTRLLSDALGGNSKTCLLITASPARQPGLDAEHAALRFARMTLLIGYLYGCLRRLNNLLLVF